MTIQNYSDIKTGEGRYSPSYVITEDEIIDFAGEWNPEGYHIDKEQVRNHQLGRIFASGIHLLAICTKLGTEMQPRPETVAGLGWNDIQFLHPVFAGDELTLKLSILEKRRSNSKPDKAIIKYGFELMNQSNQVVLTYTVDAMIKCND